MKTEIKDLGNGLKQITEFYYNGKVFCKHQELNCKKQGEEVWYYDSGQIKRKCNWDNGNLQGEEIWYSENGQVKYKAYWNNDKCISEIRYNEDGSIKKTLKQ